MPSILRKTCVPVLLLFLTCGGAGAQEAKGPETLYEMVPHVVLPQSIQYKPMPTSLSRPGAYTAHTNYPATYTAFPSYVLPYPAEMTSVQQTVYPITQVAHQPQPIVFPQPAAATAEQQQSVLLIIATPTPTTQPERPVLETRPIPALPRAIRKTNPVREIDLYEEEENGFEEIDTDSFGELPGLTSNISDSIESFVSRKTAPFASRYGMSEITQVQWSTPAPAYPTPAPFNPGPFANANLSGVVNNCAGQGYYNDPFRVPSPTPDPMGNLSPYVAAASTYGVYPQYANPYPYPQGPQTAATDPSGSSTPGLSQDVLNQIEQLIQKNPNVQFSAVMMGPNGQMIPINNGVPASGQQTAQGGTAHPQQMPQMQQLQSQMQYIQAMNQYVQRVNAARANNQCVSPQSPYNAYQGGGYPGYGQFGGYAPYVQPIPGSQGAYALPNPYYQAMYQSLSSGYAQPNYGYGYGYGPMFNPYLPTPQGYHGMVPSQQNQEKEKTFWERFRERRKKGEKQMCDAWRAPHYPEETGMRMPSKDAYPWGYFGSHTSPLDTPNFGGYYGMYYGSNTYPGL